MQELIRNIDFIGKNSDFPTHEKVVNLLVNSVMLYQNKAVLQGNIPITNLDVLNPSLQSASEPMRLIPFEFKVILV